MTLPATSPSATFYYPTHIDLSPEGNSEGKNAQQHSQVASDPNDGAALNAHDEASNAHDTFAQIESKENLQQNSNGKVKRRSRITNKARSYPPTQTPLQLVNKGYTANDSAPLAPAKKENQWKHQPSHVDLSQRGTTTRQKPPIPLEVNVICTQDTKNAQASKPRSTPLHIVNKGYLDKPPVTLASRAFAQSPIEEHIANSALETPVKQPFSRSSSMDSIFTAEQINNGASSTRPTREEIENAFFEQTFGPTLNALANKRPASTDSSVIETETNNAGRPAEQINNRKTSGPSTLPNNNAAIEDSPEALHQASEKLNNKWADYLQQVIGANNGQIDEPPPPQANTSAERPAVQEANLIDAQRKATKDSADLQAAEQIKITEQMGKANRINMWANAFIQMSENSCQLLIEAARAMRRILREFLKI